MHDFNTVERLTQDQVGGKWGTKLRLLQMNEEHAAELFVSES